MLTVDLVRATRRGKELKLSKLSKNKRLELLALAESYLRSVHDAMQCRRDVLLSSFGEITVGHRDQKIAKGLQKLILDRCSFEIESPIEAAELREKVFSEATQVRKNLSHGERFNRSQILQKVGEEFSVDETQVEELLFSDLPSAQKLQSFEPISADALLAKYEISQIQAVILRATKLKVFVRSNQPEAYRKLFSAMKFRRLLFEIEPVEGGYKLDIEGPFSLFQSVTKYGLELALIIPWILKCDEWTIEANLKWGKQRSALTFELSSKDLSQNQAMSSLVEDSEQWQPPELVSFIERFKKKKQDDWQLIEETSILHLPGFGVCVPDFYFLYNETKTKVYFELLGHWSRDAVWRRVELVKAGLEQNILFAVPEKLRVSDKVLPENLPAAIYLFKGMLSVNQILEKLKNLVVS